MSDADSKPSLRQRLSRRTVFAGAGGVGALAAVAAVLPLANTAPASEATADARPAQDDADGRYQLTAHVQRYYQTAKV